VEVEHAKIKTSVRNTRSKIMPIRKVKGGYKWGSQGKVYKSRAGAVRQARAAYASGYKKKKR